MGRPVGPTEVLNLPCPHCARVMPTRQGLNGHLGRVHKDYPDREKLCSSCNQTKSLVEFPTVSGTDPVRYRAACFNCKNEAGKKYSTVVASERNATQRRDARKKAKNHFGLTLEEFDTFVANFRVSQDNKCAGCLQDLTDAKLDHDHETMFVRGLLCRTCNLALGMVKDSSEVLIRLAEYLTLTKERYQASMSSNTNISEANASDSN